MMWGSNIPMTRTPDAHFMTEARYRGQKTVVVSPDYSDHTKFADEWLPARGDDHDSGSSGPAVGAHLVTTVLDLMPAQYGVRRDGLPGSWPGDYSDPEPYTPAWQEPITGVSAGDVERVARELARNADGVLAAGAADPRAAMHPADVNALAARLGWMPSYPTCERNPLQLASDAEREGLDSCCSPPSPRDACSCCSRSTASTALEAPRHVPAGKLVRFYVTPIDVNHKSQSTMIEAGNLTLAIMRIEDFGGTSPATAITKPEPRFLV